MNDVIYATPISLGSVPTVAALGIVGKLDITFPYHGSLQSKDVVQLFRDAVEEILFGTIKD